MNDDPYDGYDQSLRDAFRDLQRRVRRFTIAEEMGPSAENTVARFETEVLRRGRQSSVTRRAIEEELAEDNGAALAALDAALGLTHAMAVVFSSGQFGIGNPPAPIPYVFTAISVRAVSVGHEICALLRAGFPVGAHARWRTLYELDVVASVLALGNRSTAARYVNHRWVQLANDLERADPPRQWPSGLGSSPAAKRALFVRRYGKPFGSTYGWAAELSKRRLGVARPTFKDLERLVDLRKHKSRVHEAHHGVHADSFGALLTVDDTELFHSGARRTGTPAGCLETIVVLCETLDGLMRLWNDYARSRDVEVFRALLGELSLSLRSFCLDGRALANLDNQLGSLLFRE